MDLAGIKVDTKVEEDGDWVELGQFDGRLEGAEIRTRSIHSPQFRRAAQRLRRKLTVRAGGMVDPVKELEVTREAIAVGCLLGWRGVTDGGQSVEFTTEAAKRYLTDPQYRVFSEACAAAAMQIGQEDKEFLEETLPNSSRESAGS